MHRTTRRFWRCFENLPIPVQEIARENFSLLEANSRHTSLHFKEVGKFWSARVGIGYRALAIKDQDDFIWVWIGPHSEYDRLINL